MSTACIIYTKYNGELNKAFLLCKVNFGFQVDPRTIDCIYLIKT